MSYHQDKLHIQSQILEIEKLLAMANGNPFIEISLNERLTELKEQLDQFIERIEPKIKLLFSGDAVYGSLGISSNFVSRTMIPIQNLIRLQTSVSRYGNNDSKRGTIRGKKLSELYLTTLERGSFGYELSLLNPKDLFEEEEVAQSIKSVIDIINDISNSDETFEQRIQSLPARGLGFLNSFFKEVSNNNSILKIESGSEYIELSSTQVKRSYSRVSSTICNEEEVTEKAFFKGALIDTGKFEISTPFGMKINGDISADLTQDEIAQYNRDFSNEECMVTLMKFTTIYHNGNERTTYELMKIHPV
ncbi:MULTISPECIES: hypothetical protein [Bacteroidales]|jgi:archaellin|uniref:hypothetical protein n=1 Tax=Bacteroidales TaxID=171549 RepID=UPI000F476FA2|nr:MULTISPECIES: hypothetical protein [Bacteroidales]ROT10383.1 hypothetical protein EEL42_03195 [Muribaculaceae bacterium Isolate-100 (HZI)]RXE66243.1 hypothetical protein ED388_04470 [Muribaculaceae bacterium Isolate-007 (NCI)]TGX80341.1 hypothetical protein E5360_10860 [Muribaculum intestinale]